MIGEDVQMRRGERRKAFSERARDGREDIRLEVRFDAVQLPVSEGRKTNHGEHALTSHAGVDPAALEVTRTGNDDFVLGVHEHEIPNLQPVVVGRVRVGLLRMGKYAYSEEDFGTVAAGRVAGAHAPEIISVVARGDLVVAEATDLQ